MIQFPATLTPGTLLVSDSTRHEAAVLEETDGGFIIGNMNNREVRELGLEYLEKGPWRLK